MKRKMPESPTDILIRGLREITKQVHALAHRAQQPGGTVLCEVNIPLRLRFMVTSSTERDAIMTALDDALRGLPGVETAIHPDPAHQAWELLSRRL